MSFVVVLAALAFLMFAAYRGYSVILFAPLAALGAVLLTDPSAVAPVFTGIFMEKMVGFVKLYFPVFMLGAVFGKVIELSGFSESIVAAATALAILFPRLTVLMTVLAVLVAASRFLTTVHFVSDVIAGAYVGLATALVMRRYFERTGIPLAWSAPNPGIALSSLR